MLKLTRLLILISVAFLAARPVMACCLTGHGETAMAEMKVESPPCHDEVAAGHHGAAEEKQKPSSPFDCPGCIDCDTAVMQAHSVDDGAVLNQLPSEIPFIVLAARFDGFEHKSTVFKTGPPGDPPLPLPTPITLKQRLLI